MIMGIGMGNSALTQNFAKERSNQRKNGVLLLGGLNGDRGQIVDEGDENVNMEDEQMQY